MKQRAAVLAAKVHNEISLWVAGMNFKKGYLGIATMVKIWDHMLRESLV